jgi:hypothetical protein
MVMYPAYRNCAPDDVTQCSQWIVIVYFWSFLLVHMHFWSIHWLMDSWLAD